MRIGISSAVLLIASIAFFAFTAKPTLPPQEEKDECPCEVEDSLTQKELLCMNSAAKIYSCLNGIDVKPEEVFSCEWYLYTGEETILRRYDKDEMPLVIKNNILKAKVLWIRGIRLQDEAGVPTEVYLRKRAKIRFKSYKQEPN
ncbi:MAG: hypothetical protein ACPGLV_03275 [Bacteroidia bacterium]